MRSIKLTFLLLLVALASSAQGNDEYVQPMSYKNYSFPWQVNIGVGLPVRKTSQKVYLEIGPASGASKVMLPPRLTSTELSLISGIPEAGFFYNKTSKRYGYHNGLGIKYFATTEDTTKEEMDVFWLMGQSQLKGNGDNADFSPNPSPGTVFMWTGRYGFQPITDEVKGAYEVKQSTGVSDGWQDPNVSSIVPSLGITYYNITGRKVCFIQCAISGSGIMYRSMPAVGFAPTRYIHNWGNGGTLYDSSVSSLNRALTAISNAGFLPKLKGVIWNQGETDAIAINGALVTQQEYLDSTRARFAKIRTDFGAQLPIYLWKIGTANNQSDAGFVQVRAAQDTLVKYDSLTTTSFDKGVEFAKYNGGILCKDGACHFITIALNEVGRIIGEDIAGANTNQFKYDRFTGLSYKRRDVSIDNNLFVPQIVGGTSSTSGLTLKTTTGASGTQPFRIIGGNNGDKTLFSIPYNPGGANFYTLSFGGNRGILGILSESSTDYSGIQLRRTSSERANIILLGTSTTSTGLSDVSGSELAISNQNGKLAMGANVGGGLPSTAFAIMNGKVTVGSIAEANNSAALEIISTSRGFLPPRMSGSQAEAISSPAEGLMIYSTDGSGATITSKGWWGYDGTTWVKLN